MSWNEIVTPNAPGPTGWFSQGVMWDRLIITSGQVGMDPATGELPERFEDEVEQAIVNLGAVLNAAGVGLDAVVKTTCFVTDVSKFEVFDRTYKRAFMGVPPARSTIGVQLAGALRFEIEAMAIREK